MFDLTDIDEKEFNQIYPGIINILLKDNTTNSNIIWATDLYQKKGIGYRFNDCIKEYTVISERKIIMPRSKKNKEELQKRIKEKAEVFTPPWICNKQNNSIDEQWFGYADVFNIEQENGWVINKNKINIPNNKTWIDYVKLPRLEITCGEAPYIVSRYDSVTGDFLEIKNRIGILDRKFRIILENITSREEFITYSLEALKSVYGYEWQGDSLFLARENILMSFIDYYCLYVKDNPSLELLKEVAEIISWNFWQMDGIKFVVPNSCVTKKESMIDLFGDEIVFETECEGCKKDLYYKHNGIYCKIMDWEKNKKVTFMSVVTKGL